MGRGGYNKIKRRFVGRVINTGQPVPGAVRPVISKKNAVTVFVFGDDQSILRNTFVSNFYVFVLAALNKGGKFNGKQVVSMVVGQWLSFFCDLQYRHSFWGIVFGNKVECNGFGIFYNQYIDRRFPFYQIAGISKVYGELIVLY